MKMKRILSAAIAAAMMGTLMTGCGKSDSSSEKSGDGEGSSVVNIAIQPSAAFIPLYIARENGWIEEALKEQNVTVNWNDFESGPPMNESLAAGSSDIGVMGDVPTVSAIAAGQKTEIVAMAADGPDSYAMLVSADSDINTAADLKGKKIATVVGSTGHNLTDKLLKTAGLDINTDVELVNISAGDAATVLSNGEVDAVAMWEPTNTRLVDNGTAKVIATGSDCGLLGVNPIIARSEYADANPEVIKVIIEQYARGVQALENLDDDTKAKVAADLSLEADQLDSVAAKYNYTVEISDDDIANLQDTIQFLVKIGTLDEEYDFTPYADRDFTKSANISQYLG
jgi:sulfonate transport system substrate-binding protein